MATFDDITGQRFGRLTVTERAENRNGVAWWKCTCDCGKVTEVRGAVLRNGHTKSCGCGSAIKAKHRLRKSPEYTVWVNMRGRCNDPNDHSYADYGGRGIRVCSRWEQSFENFYADMGQRPSKNHQIERTNNAGPYSPDNCRWATRIEQCNNRRSTVLVEWRGMKQTLPQWCRQVGLPHRTVWHRINKAGWSVEQALTTPLRPWGPGKPRA